MFKYTIVVAALAASAGLAANVPTPSADNTRQEPSTAAASGAMTGGHRTARRLEKTALSSNVHDAHGDSSSSDDLIAAGVLGVLETVSVPKQLLGAAVGHVVRKLKSLDLKKFWKSAVFGALVTALGAAAAVAVAGLVSVVSSICATLPPANKNLYDHGHDYPQMDAVGDFVLDAFGKHDQLH